MGNRIIIVQAFKCIECSQTITREEYAYGHDCEVE